MPVNEFSVLIAELPFAPAVTERTWNLSNIPNEETLETATASCDLLRDQSYLSRQAPPKLFVAFVLIPTSLNFIANLNPILLRIGLF